MSYGIGAATEAAQARPAETLDECLGRLTEQVGRAGAILAGATAIADKLAGETPKTGERDGRLSAVSSGYVDALSQQITALERIVNALNSEQGRITRAISS